MQKRLTSRVISGKAQIPPDDAIVVFHPHGAMWISDPITDAQAEACENHPSFSVLEVADDFKPASLAAENVNLSDRGQVLRYLAQAGPAIIVAVINDNPRAIEAFINAMSADGLADVVRRYVAVDKIVEAVEEPAQILARWLQSNADNGAVLPIEAALVPNTPPASTKPAKVEKPATPPASPSKQKVEPPETPAAPKGRRGAAAAEKPAADATADQKPDDQTSPAAVDGGDNAGADQASDADANKSDGDTTDAVDDQKPPDDQTSPAPQTAEQGTGQDDNSGADPAKAE